MTVMDGAEVRKMAEGLLAAHGLAEWKFGWNRRKRALGLCRYHLKRIELSVHFVVANGEEEIRETILHEIAHALAGQKAGHGAAWKAVCRRIGCKPERCDNGTAVMPAGRWHAACPGCGKQYSRHRRPQKRAKYWCRHCGPERGAVTFAAA